MLTFDFEIFLTFYDGLFNKNDNFSVFCRIRGQEIFFIISNRQIRVFQLKIPLYMHFKNEYANFRARANV